MHREIILSEQIKALGDSCRLEILQLLPDSANCEHGNNVSQLAEKLNTPQPTISHHLKVLKNAGIISNKKMCRDVFYWIDHKQANLVIEALQSIFKHKLDKSTEKE